MTSDIIAVISILVFFILVFLVAVFYLFVESKDNQERILEMMKRYEAEKRWGDYK